MKYNTASQSIGAQMISVTDGSIVTSGITAYVTVDAGTQALGATASGACTHEGNGYHTYLPTQAETSGELIAFTFIGSGAIASTVQVYTSYPQTGDSYPFVTGVSNSGVATAVWDSDATSHQIQGSFGQAIGDPVADSNSIFKATVTDASGTTVGVDTTSLLGVIGTPTGTTISQDISLISLATNAGDIASKVPDSGIVITGSVISGTYADAISDDSSFWITAPAAAVSGYGLRQTLWFDLPLNRTPTQLAIYGWFNGNQEVTDIYALNIKTGIYDLLTNSSTQMTSRNNETLYHITVPRDYSDDTGGSNNIVAIELRSTSTNTANRLRIDQALLYHVNEAVFLAPTVTEISNQVNFDITNLHGSGDYNLTAAEVSTQVNNDFTSLHGSGNYNVSAVDISNQVNSDLTSLHGSGDYTASGSPTAQQISDVVNTDITSLHGSGDYNLTATEVSTQVNNDFTSLHGSGDYNVSAIDISNQVNSDLTSLHGSGSYSSTGSSPTAQEISDIVNADITSLHGSGDYNLTATEVSTQVNNDFTSLHGSGDYNVSAVDISNQVNSDITSLHGSGSYSSSGGSPTAQEISDAVNADITSLHGSGDYNLTATGVSDQVNNDFTSLHGSGNYNISATDISNQVNSDITSVHGSGNYVGITPAEVNAEMVDVLSTDVYTELVSVPSATSSLKDKLTWLFMLGRNKFTQTSTTQLLKADDDGTTIGTATVSDDGTTFTKGKIS